MMLLKLIDLLFYFYLITSEFYSRKLLLSTDSQCEPIVVSMAINVGSTRQPPTLSIEFVISAEKLPKTARSLSTNTYHKSAIKLP